MCSVILQDALAPVIAVAAALTLGLLSRWVFSPTRAQRQRRERLRAAHDFGLLVPLATLGARQEAERGRARLAAHGIRATVAAVPGGPVQVTADGDVLRPPGGHQILVFPDDAPRAAQVLAPGG